MTVRTVEDMLHYAQASVDRDRRARFAKQCPEAAEAFERAERWKNELLEDIQTAFGMGDEREVSNAAHKAQRDLVRVAQEWYTAKHAYQRFLERDLAPVFVRCSVCGHAKNDAACQKAHP